MSDDENNFEVDSDFDEDEQSMMSNGANGHSLMLGGCNTAEKRAHHNALERKRRDHIKDSFCDLRDSIPVLTGEKASRAQILKKSAEYIQGMVHKNSSLQREIEDLKRQNRLLEEQISKALGRNKSENGSAGSDESLKTGSMSSFDDSD